MDNNYPYHVQPDTSSEQTQQSDTPPEEPKKPKKPRHRWHWVAVLVVLVVAGSVVYHLVTFPHVSFHRTPNGFSFSVGSGRDHAPGFKNNNGGKSDASDADKKPPFTSPDTSVTINPSPESVKTPMSKEEGALSLQELYERVLPSVVTITTSTQGGQALGTGVILTQDGYLLTNQHVIEGAASVSVQLSDSREFDADIVGSDEISDLAVLKITADGLTAAELGDSDALRVGDSVAAIGSPIGVGLRGTLTDGIISGISRDMTVSGRKMTLLQTNTALNSGNSGGPLINCYGQVIGINTMKLGSSSYFSSASVEGLGFAIPTTTAKPIVDELISKGYVSGRPALGVRVDDIPMRTRFYYGLPDGVYLSYVDPDSDAAAQGLQEGDIITAVDGTAVSTAYDLSGVLAGYSVGDSVSLTVYRSRTTFTVSVKLMDRYAVS